MSGHSPDLTPTVGFRPIARPDARALLLGSLPSELSLRCGEYYANPTNQFWSIMDGLMGASNKLPYADRIARLTENRIALWDVCAAARRSGSLDSNIETRTVEPNDFSTFLSSHQQIRGICFNGQKAAAIFRKRAAPTLGLAMRGIRCETLPSSSNAHCAMAFDGKLERWRAALDEVLTCPN